MSDNMSNSILKNLCKIVLNFELSRRHPRRGRQRMSHLRCSPRESQPYHVWLRFRSWLSHALDARNGVEPTVTDMVTLCASSFRYSEHSLDLAPPLPLAPMEAHKQHCVQRARSLALLLRTDDVVLWRARLPMDHLDVDL
jgi:hypothetical protein